MQFRDTSILFIKNDKDVLISTGNASTTDFNIKCYDWKDEGPEDERDVIEDRKAQNPLRYEFLTVEYISEENGVESEKLTSFQFGGTV